MINQTKSVQRIVLLALLALGPPLAPLEAQQRATMSGAAVYEHELSGTAAEGGGVGWAVTGGVWLGQSLLAEGGIRRWQYGCRFGRSCGLGSLFVRLRPEFLLGRSGLAAGIGARIGIVFFSNESNDPYWGIEAAPEIVLAQRIARVRLELSAAATYFSLSGGIQSSLAVGLGARIVFGSRGAT